MKPFINYIIDSEEIKYIPAANEGDAIGIAAGTYLGGKLPVVMLQNSGLGNTVNPITSLLQTFNIPSLIIVTLRGDPKKELDEPQHQLMGHITTNLLDLMELPWSWFPIDDGDIDKQLDLVTKSIQDNRKSYVLVMRQGSVEPYEIKKSIDIGKPSFSLPKKGDIKQRLEFRRTILQSIINKTDKNDLLIATTGYTGRELYDVGDQDNNFYMVGSMGCAIDIGLGLAIAQSDKKVIVIDGDGSILMRLGAMSTVGYELPRNLMHLVLDNGSYESTGSQQTVSKVINFKNIASACGYNYVLSTSSVSELEANIQTFPVGPSFIHVPIKNGIESELPRPLITPTEVALRFRNNILKDH